jgi:glycosyltransferase involved in cell wall biosynthesis
VIGSSRTDGAELPRILHVVRRLCFGGLEFGMINLIRGLERHGFTQAVCCLEDRGELAHLLPESVPVWACSEGTAAPRVPWRAARLFRTWGPDVVHARNGGAWIDAGVAWLLAGRPGQLVFSVHGWDRVGRMSWKRAFIYRRLAWVTRRMVAVSAETAQQFADEAGIPLRRFTVLGSGVDTESFRPSAEPRDPRPAARLVLGCVGRLDPVKAHDVLIDAFTRVVGAGLDLELRLLGDGPCRPSLERLVRDRGLTDRVRFLGMVHDVPEHLRDQDLFVLASHREGRPTSIMEAMASGLPVVATRVGSVAELVAEGRTGLLAEPGDVEGLAQAIRTLAADATLRRRFAEEARRFAVSELSLGGMVQRYAAFYRDVARDS